ncbi:tRNA (guanosine(37)-N1)-methyltransferase TrmD [Candidatus Microgenomates bacterium]|nr:tRNA (guanosine(37)-N1)-methyltransferase TrmD [Candidatus Microgenomates bacterium]
MQIDILTLFPKMFKGPFDESIVKRAQEKGLVKISIHDLRKWSQDAHKTVDDRPYGGGAGMIMRVDVIERAILKIKNQKSKIILLTPQGKVFNQKTAKKLSKHDHLILICGHYEGIDERVRENLVDEEISIGDYILTGGELPAMIVTDAIVRLIPNVLKKPEAIKEESFSKNLLEFPQYTRPADFKNWKVPKVLLSGDHKKIEKWRKKKALEKTKKRRPDLL